MQLGEKAYDHYLSRKRQLPEIEGSQGAFIALVVSLSVLIVVCCAAVFYLLRHHEPTERDRAIRRERYRRHREERDASSSLPSSLSSLGDKFKQMWRTRSSGGRRGGRGWIQAGSGDEWESDSDHGDPERAGARAQGRQMQAFSTRGIEDRAHVVESPLSEEGSGNGFIPVHYADPFSKESPPSSQMISPLQMHLERSQSPLSLGSPREGSVENDSDAHSPPDPRHLSTLSNASVWTHGGSKFIEDI
ncbi:hypothetical protein BDN67DRAFT_972739 [Paxillus ammoniavirescens]|nr:hypothetical protein BDN67DRAFT_972739 [Paxillus ammoniavirescens]